MSLADEVTNAIKNVPQPASSDADKELKKWLDFNDEMKRTGLIKVRKYDLPQADTIGRFVPTRRSRR